MSSEYHAISSIRVNGNQNEQDHPHPLIFFILEQFEYAFVHLFLIMKSTTFYSNCSHLIEVAFSCGTHYDLMLISHMYCLQMQMRFHSKLK